MSPRGLRVVVLSGGLFAASAVFVGDALARGGGIRSGGSASISRGGGAHTGGGARTGTARSTSASAGARVNRGGDVHARGGNTVVRGGDVNVNRNTNINVDNDGWGGWDDHYHPVARGVAFGTAAAVTSAAIGSMYRTLPPACSPYPYSGYTYYNCGGYYLQPQYQGDTVVYVTVENPG